MNLIEKRMKITPIKVKCLNCPHGYMGEFSQHDEKGNPIICVITEDEKIMFLGQCNFCGKQMSWAQSILQLLFDCPTDRPIN